MSTTNILKLRRAGSLPAKALVYVVDEASGDKDGKNLAIYANDMVGGAEYVRGARPIGTIGGAIDAALSAAEGAQPAAEAAMAARDVAQIAASDAQTSRSNASAQASSAEASRLAAEGARDAAIIQAGVYETEAIGRAAVADGVAFKVQGSGDVAALEYRRTNSTTSVLIASYPASDAVTRPNWSGKKNGWPDTFFRHSQVAIDFLGRKRWRGHSGGNNYAGCSIATSALNPFDGSVFRKTGAGLQAGPLIWLDEIGAAPGDVITFTSQLIGTPGRDGYMLGDFYTAANAPTGAAIVGGAWSSIRDSGASGLILSASPQRLRASITVPSGAEAVHVRFYSSTAGASDILDVLGLWVVKAAAAPAWATLNDDTWMAMTIQQQEAVIATQATRITTLESEKQATGLREFKLALTNPLYQFLGVVFPGDSITHGLTTTGQNAIQPSPPRNGSLADARNNGASPSWLNLLHKYLGTEYYEDSVATEAAWPGSPSGVAIFEYNSIVNLFPGYSPFIRSNTNTASPGAWTQVYNAGTKLGFYIQAATTNAADNLRLKWAMTGYEFDVVFAAQSNGAAYELLVNGVSQGNFSTQTGDTGLPVSFGNVRTHSLGGFKKDAVVEMRLIPGDAARTNLRIEAVTVNRRLRVTNQGIIGTSAARFFVDGMVTSCLQDGDIFAFVQLGTNDRSIVASYGLPESPSTLKYNMGRLCDTWEAAGIRPIVMCANAVPGVVDVPPAYKYNMSAVRETLRQFAAERRLDFIDQFAETRALFAAGDTSWCEPAGPHPLDSGHAIMFSTIRRRIDAA